MEGLEIDQIRDILKSKEEFKLALRLQMVYLLAQGKSSREVAEIYQVSFKQVLNWAHRFRQEGLEGLKDKPGRGRRASLSDTSLEEIKHMVLNVSPSELGYSSSSGRWTGTLLLSWINKEYNTTFKSTQVYKLIDKMGLELKKGKGCVLKK